jgi:hypothetical protein
MDSAGLDRAVNLVQARGVCAQDFLASEFLSPLGLRDTARRVQATRPRPATP